MQAIRSLVIALGLLALSFATARAEGNVDLVGTWHVLIHYRNANTANPDSDRWDDRVWVFERKGSRLQWTEYPIVVFSDGTGRFGPVAGNPRARIMHAWEPNEEQLAEIRRGLQVNQRGKKEKSLKGSAEKGWKTLDRQRSFSASTVGYQETWTIDDPTGKPIFTLDDALGTEVAIATEDSDAVATGRTRYTTVEVVETGNILSGTFARDEHRKGTFKMHRAGAPRGLESDGRSPNQKASERFIQDEVERNRKEQGD